MYVKNYHVFDHLVSTLWLGWGAEISRAQQNVSARCTSANTYSTVSSPALLICNRGRLGDRYSLYVACLALLLVVRWRREPRRKECKQSLNTNGSTLSYILSALAPIPPRQISMRSYAATFEPAKHPLLAVPQPQLWRLLFLP